MQQPQAILETADTCVPQPIHSLPEVHVDVKANILLVDDRPDKLLALESVLEGLGQNIVKATSGKEALRCLLKQDFAVILLDVAMPVMDGFETAAMIRSRERSERTPIIFVTSHGATETHITRGYSLGAVDYLLTPIVPEVLCTKVSVFVELFRQTELLKRQTEQLRRLEESRHKKELAVFADRLEAETRRNRFFTLAIDLLGIADLEGKLLQVNPSWELVLGYSSVELGARSLGSLAVEGDRNALSSALQNAAKNENAPVCYEGQFCHADGSHRWISWTFAPFKAEKLLYLFGKDVTNLKESQTQISRLNRELQEKLGALTAANSELEAFNYSIAHDLRAPLRSMGSFADALLEDEADRLSPQGVEFAGRILRSAKYMDTLLQDLLAYGKLGKVDMPSIDVCLDSEVQQTLQLFSDQLASRGAEVEVQSPLGNARAHPPTVRQILTNLVDNALKFFSPDRPPRLRFWTTADGPWLRLWVEDNGIGIPERHHNLVFGLFRRLHTPEKYPGTGVGLAIVRRAAERMGGGAGVESVPGEGSKFWVELPQT